MITQEVIEHLNWIRKSEKVSYCNMLDLLSKHQSSFVHSLLNLPNLPGTVDKGNKHLIRQKSYISIILILIQESQRLELLNTTKFIARKYFDIFLATHPLTPPQHLILTAITCLRTAVKVNSSLNQFSENTDVSCLYTIDYAVQQSGGIYSIGQFHEYEAELLRCMQFQMNLSTPQDFMGVLKLLP